jgi:glycosyltransferase involved in cell wall biosynthesis
VTPSASVIVCTLNRCTLLDGCLESLAVQQLAPDDYEIVVVDNGSSDETQGVVRRWMRRVENVRLEFEPRTGLSRARNAGIRTARGNVVAFLDDDAVATKGWLAALLRAHAHWPGIGAVGGPTWLALRGGRPSWLAPDLESWFSGLDLGHQLRLLEDSEIPFGTNMSILRKAVTSVGGFAPELGRRGNSLISNEEKEFFSRLRDADYGLAYQPAAGVWHRVTKDRLSPLWLIRRAYAQGRSDVAFRRLRSEEPGRDSLTREAAVRMVLSATLRGWGTVITSLGEAEDKPGLAMRHAMRRAMRIGHARETLRPSLTRGRAGGTRTPRPREVIVPMSERRVAMTAKADFTPEEWQVVLEGPPSAGMIVVTAQRGGTFRETIAMAKAYAEARKQHGESELLDEIVSAKPELDHTRYHSAEELRENALRHLRDAVAVLERKATPEELEDYRRFVLNLADRVAAAHREDGDTVSPAERAAIQEIASSLGTTAPSV